QALLTGHQEHPPPSLWALEWDVWCRSTRGRDKGRIRCRPLRNMLRMLSGDPLFPPLPCLVLTFACGPPLWEQYRHTCRPAGPFQGSPFCFHQSASQSPALSPPARVLPLADHGWDAKRERSFALSQVDGLVPGRVVRAEHGLHDVVAETGSVRAAVTSDRPTPCTGDWVVVQPVDAATSATVVEVLECRTAVVRSISSRTSQAQVLAANVDTVAVTVSLVDPLKHRRIKRMLATPHLWWCSPRPAGAPTPCRRPPIWPRSLRVWKCWSPAPPPERA